MALGLDSSSVFVPTTITDFVASVMALGDTSLKLSKLNEFITKLEEERLKIGAIERELPLSFILVNEAINWVKNEVRGIVKGLDLRREGVVKEFLPLMEEKKSFDEDEEDEEEDEDDEEEEIDLNEKRNWMSSAQLWSSNVDPELTPRREVVVEEEEEEEDRVRKDTPLMDSISLSLSVPQISDLNRGSSSLTTTNSISNSNSRTSNGNNSNIFRGVSGSSSGFLAEKENSLPNKAQTLHQSPRKQRRCWSPELHRRFIDALQQLGGSQATPKQIRELMHVEGLTNDEVKSHLQKYRLHVRKVPSSQATQDDSGDNSKANMSVSQSGSPQGHFLGNGSLKVSINGGDDSTELDEDDEKSDGHSWRGQTGNNRRK